MKKVTSIFQKDKNIFLISKIEILYNKVLITISRLLKVIFRK